MHLVIALVTRQHSNQKRRWKASALSAKQINKRVSQLTLSHHALLQCEWGSCLSLLLQFDVSPTMLSCSVTSVCPW